MRETLFRGKRFGDDEWTYWDKYGRITDINGEPTKTEIDMPTLLRYPIYISDLPIINDGTVGEYTGLTDKNGKRIFEGDIVKTWRNNIGKIEFGQYWDEEIEADFYGYAWIGKDEYGESITLSLDKRWGGHEVISNIHDNAELLEEGDKRE